MDKDLPIGVFDSGFGGLTVLRAIKSILPSESFIYFGDTARLPYGSKSGETIIRYSLENASFLHSMGIKALVVACHTACSFALKALEKSLSIPVIGVIAPAIAKIQRLSPKGKIGVIATRATIASGTYQSQLFPNPVEATACPLFVPLVEEGLIDHPITDLAIQEYLQPFKDKKIDTLLLGCTHYPLLKERIEHFLGSDVMILDPGEACAEALKTLLAQQDMFSPTSLGDQFFVSDGPEQFRRLGPSFLGHPIIEVSIPNWKAADIPLERNASVYG